jgi:predicted dehydrogenase
VPSEPTPDDYALATRAVAEVPAPDLPYRPPRPARPHRIGVIGCGGISQAHLEAYRRAGFDVVALADRTLAKAERRRVEFYPHARVSRDARALIEAPDIEVLDVTPHEPDRVPLVRAALEAGKHVLSQKPFVVDLDEGEALCALADGRGVRLAVNQNGRWAPHLAWMREAVRAGLVGDVVSVHVGIHWDHTWTAGTPFERMTHLVLFDFGIHWLDFVASLAGDRVRLVRATRTRARGQTIATAMLAQVLIALDGGQASLVFDAHLPYGPLDTTYVGGTRGSLVSSGPNLGEQAVALYTAGGVARPALDGRWFNDGFAGAMGELLCAIEEGRRPLNDARGNLASLALAFAAAQASLDGAPHVPGSIRRLPDPGLRSER